MYRFLVFILVFFNLQVFSQVPGNLDLSFGSAGKVILDVGDLDHCEDVVIDTNNNIYFAGYTTVIGSPTNTDFVLGKLTPTGLLDVSFGTNGYYKGDFPKSNASAIHNIEMLDDGLLIFGSGLKYGVADTQYLFVSKVLFSGMLDTTFADSGTFSGVFLTAYNYPGSIAIQDNGKIVVCGSAYDSLTLQDVPIIGRLMADGSPDVSFSPTGFKYWDMSSPLQNASNIFPSMPEHGAGGFFEDVLIMDNGNYFFSGFYDTGSTIHCLMAMIDSSSNFVSNFGLSGYSIFQHNPSYSNKIVKSILYKGQILLGIQLDGMNSNVDFLIQPIDTLGAFSSVISTDFNGQRDLLKDMAVKDGQLYLSGYSTLNANIQAGYESDFFTVAKYDEFGAINNQFASNGLIEEDFGTADEAGSTSIYLKGNKIIVAGYLNNIVGSNITDFGFMCFYNDNALQIKGVISKNGIQIYPNPAIDKVKIVASEEIELIQLFSIEGKKITVNNSTIFNEATIDLSAISDGIYIVEITTIDRQVERSRIVVQ